MDQEVLAIFRASCSIPAEMAIRLPCADERPWSPPKGYFCVFECFFSRIGMRFPIPRYFFDYCENHLLATSQIFHSVARHLLCCAELAKAARIQFDAEFFERILLLRPGPNTSDPFSIKKTFFSTTMKNKVSAGPSISKIHNWERYYFFVRYNTASAESTQPKLYSEWRTEAGKIDASTGAA